MSYAQKDYQEHVGNGPFSLAEIGCFVVAFSNLLEKFGEGIAPDALNTFFTDHNVYLADPADGQGVKDDLTWSSIVSYDHTVNIVSTGAGGWPNSDTAIVEFRYQHQGKEITHFCCMASAAEHTIIDSYDGQIKVPGIYGEPVAFAIYDRNKPLAVPVPAPQGGVPAAPNIPAPDYDGTSITVQPGWGLARAAQAAGYPDWDAPGRWAVIAALNGYISSDWPRFNAALQPGERIRVGNSANAAKPAPAPVAPESVRVITVAPGWGLERVAAAAGRSDAALPECWQLIAQANGSNDWQAFNKALKPGQQVKVPLEGGHGEGESTGTTLDAAQAAGVPMSEAQALPTATPANAVITSQGNSGEIVMKLLKLSLPTKQQLVHTGEFLFIGFVGTFIAVWVKQPQPFTEQAILAAYGGAVGVLIGLAKGFLTTL